MEEHGLLDGGTPGSGAVTKTSAVTDAWTADGEFTLLHTGDGKLTQEMANLHRRWKTYAGDGKLTQEMANLRRGWQTYTADDKLIRTIMIVH